MAADSSVITPRAIALGGLSDWFTLSVCLWAVLTFAVRAADVEPYTAPRHLSWYFQGSAILFVYFNGTVSCGYVGRLRTAGSSVW